MIWYMIWYDMIWYDMIWNGMIWHDMTWYMIYDMMWYIWYNIYIYIYNTVRHCGPGSIFGIATGYRLDGPRIESRWGARFSAPVQAGPAAHPAFCTMCTASFPGVKSGRGVTLTPHPLLVPWSWKSRTIPLLPLRAVRPVQSLSACTRMHLQLDTTLYHCIPPPHNHTVNSIFYGFKIYCMKYHI